MKKILILMSLLSYLGANCDALKKDYQDDIAKADKIGQKGGKDVFTQFAAYYSRANAYLVQYTECKSEERFNILMRTIQANKSVAPQVYTTRTPSTTSTTSTPSFSTEFGTGY